MALQGLPTPRNLQKSVVPARVVFRCSRKLYGHETAKTGSELKPFVAHFDGRESSKRDSSCVAQARVDCGSTVAPLLTENATATEYCISTPPRLATYNIATPSPPRFAGRPDAVSDIQFTDVLDLPEFQIDDSMSIGQNLN